MAVIVPQIPFIRRRKRRLLAPLMIVSTSVQALAGALEVTLVVNTTEAAPLADMTLADASKWMARFDGLTYSGANIFGQNYNEIFLTMDAGSAQAGPDVISYAGPSDISDALGRKLQPFSGMPL